MALAFAIPMAFAYARESLQTSPAGARAGHWTPSADLRAPARSLARLGPVVIALGSSVAPTRMDA